MHSIKKAARRNAWYSGDDDDPQTYNPFARVSARPKARRDLEEGGLYHAHTDNPADRSNRTEDSPDSTDGVPGAVPGLRPHKSETDLDLAWTASRPRSEDHLQHEQSGDAEVKVQTAPIPAVVVEQATKPDLQHSLTNDDDSREKKRNKRRFLPWVKAEQDPTDDDDDDNKKKKKYPKLTTVGQLKSLLGTWLSLLFVFVPAGFAVRYTQQPHITIFIVNFVAIIPSNVALGYAVDEILKYVGDTLAGLINMSFGNAVQLISSVLLLKTRQVAVLRSSLIGTILQNLLVMTGLSFLLGGLRRRQQYFNAEVAQTMGMFLLLAVLSLTIPTVSQLWGHSTPGGVRAQSRGTAVIIMISYAMWLFFQLKTHVDMFHEPSKKVPKKPTTSKNKGEATKALASIGAVGGAAFAGGKIHGEPLVWDDEDEDDLPNLTRTMALGAIIFFTALLAINAEFATNSIQGVMHSHGVTPSFIGIVVLPILSNDPFAIDTAIKDKLDISIALTLERCMQTALMVIPLIVLIAWGMGVDGMTLDFDGFSVAALFASIIIVTYVVQEGKSNWLTGALLIKVFVIIGLASYFTE